MQIIISFPPDFDGELHINATEQKGPNSRAFKFEFTQTASHSETAWQTLLIAAKSILEQERRKNGK